MPCMPTRLHAFTKDSHYTAIPNSYVLPRYVTLLPRCHILAHVIQFLHHHEKHEISSTHDATAVLPQLVISGITSHSYSHVFTRLVQNNPLLRCHSRVAAIAYILPRQCEILMQWLHTNTSNYKHSNALPQP